MLFFHLEHGCAVMAAASCIGAARGQELHLAPPCITTIPMRMLNSSRRGAATWSATSRTPRGMACQCRPDDGISEQKNYLAV
eukprot:454954-Pelagomonas_calceolata.AAC.4